MLKMTSGMTESEVDGYFASRQRQAIVSSNTMVELKTLTRKLGVLSAEEERDHVSELNKRLSTSSVKFESHRPLIQVHSPDDGKTPLSAEPNECAQMCMNRIRKELLKMREKDQELARKLLTLWLEIRQMRLKRTLREHGEILDDINIAVAERQERAGRNLYDSHENLHVTTEIPHAVVLPKLSISGRRLSIA